MAVGDVDLAVVHRKGTKEFQIPNSFEPFVPLW
jgi:hypothetical protein